MCVGVNVYVCVSVEIGSFCPHYKETNILAKVQQNEKKVRIRRVMQQELTLSKAILLSSGQRDVRSGKYLAIARMKANFLAYTKNEWEKKTHKHTTK